MSVTNAMDPFNPFNSFLHCGMLSFGIRFKNHRKMERGIRQKLKENSDNSKKKRCRIISVCVVFVLIVILAIILKSRFPFFQIEKSALEPPEILKPLKEYNLIIILIDALRPDHLSCYGHFRRTSPFIDSLANEGIIFKNAYSNSSLTRESVSVLYSGRLPSSSGSVGRSAAPSLKIKNIGSLFSEAGYTTAIISLSPQLNDRRFRIGFDHVDILSSTTQISGGGPELTTQALNFIKKNKNHKFMMYLHYLDPHGPYDPPLEFYQRFQDNIPQNPISLYQQVRRNCATLIKQGFGPGEDRFEDMVMRYDAEIAHVDYSIELLIQTLRELNLEQNTLVLITADHGEEFLEHSYVEHGWTLYNESLHIPLILWAPGALSAKRIDSLVSTVDFLPTLLHLMEIPHDRNDFEGTPLFFSKENGLYFSPPTKPFIAELLVQHRNILRAVVKGNWKYIAAQRWLEPSQRPNALDRSEEIEENENLQLDIWGPVEYEALYDLSKDPHEKNILPLNKEGQKLRGILDHYRIYCEQYGLNEGPKHEKTKLSKEDREKLKALGYIK